MQIMAINFPASPSENDTYSENSITWAFNGTSWDALNEPIQGADDNFVTDAEKIILGNTSGTNTGDQTLPTDFDPAGTDNSDDNAPNATYSNVDNTSDATKPVSTAQAAAIALKMPQEGINSALGISYGGSSFAMSDTYLGSVLKMDYFEAAIVDLDDTASTLDGVVHFQAGDGFTTTLGSTAIIDQYGNSMTSYVIPAGGTAKLIKAQGDWFITNAIDPSKATLTGVETLTNKSVEFVGYTEGEVSIGTVTTAHTLTLAAGTVQSATLTAATACTFTMPAVVAGKSFILEVAQASGGTGTTVFTGVLWPDDTAPTMTSTANKVDLFSFVANRAGTAWRGSSIQNFAS